jgi:uncharacterized Tic20 family protein
MTSNPAQSGPGRGFARSQPARRPRQSPVSDPRLARSQPPGGPSPSGGQSLRPRLPLHEAKPAMLGYLAAIFLGPLIPLVMFLVARRRSPFRRFHAATAFNLSLTGLLYAVCCLILALVLAMDSVSTALVVSIPVAFAIWLSVLKYEIRGIGAANRGEPRYEVPAWVCAQILKP